MPLDRFPEQKRIMLLEDERALADVITAALTARGLSVVWFKASEPALEYLEHDSVDAIWLDHYLLGSENGFDFVLKLKSSESGLRHVPIFVVSNDTSAEKETEYKHLGITKYFVKSNYRLEEIVKEIVDALGAARV